MSILNHPAACRLCPRTEIQYIFPYVRNLVDKGLTRGSQYTIDRVFVGLLDGSLQLWTYALKAALVTSLRDRTCLLLCLSGTDMREWIHCIRNVEAWARDEGCDFMRIQGRKGWARVLGYDISGEDELGLTIVEKEL